MLVGFHGTDHEFEAFSEERFGSERTRSPNGALGVWLFTSEEHAHNLGLRILRVEVDVRNPVRYPIRRMSDDHHAAGRTDDPVGFFRDARKGLLAAGHDMIEVVEKDGDVAMVVVLDLARISSVEEIHRPPAPR